MVGIEISRLSWREALHYRHSTLRVWLQLRNCFTTAQSIPIFNECHSNLSKIPLFLLVFALVCFIAGQGGGGVVKNIRYFLSSQNTLATITVRPSNYSYEFPQPANSEKSPSPQAKQSKDNRILNSFPSMCLIRPHARMPISVSSGMCSRWGRGGG